MQPSRPVRPTSEEPRRLRRFAIVPLQRPLIRWILQIAGAIMLLWLGVFLGLNDRRLGTLVSKLVTGNVQGQFRLGYAHYDYWSSLASIILNTPARIRGGDYRLIDPDGHVVLSVETVEAQMYIGELIRSLIRSAFSAPLGQGMFIDLHFLAGSINGAVADIHPSDTSLAKTPDRPVMNIVAAMNSKRPSPEGAPPGPGRVLITVDGDGIHIKDARFAMGTPFWRAQIEGLSGTATLRFSTAATENSPGIQSFHFEVAPVTGRRGELDIFVEPEPLRFALSDIALRRFGARESRKQDISFRGSARAHGALIEMDGKLLDIYCDTGVSLQASFEQAGALASYATKGLLIGQPRGRLRLFGPLSDKLPTTVQGQLSACVGNSLRQDPYPAGPNKRALYAEGMVDQAEAVLADIHATEGRGRFTLLHGIMTLPDLSATVLGGHARAEPLRIFFLTPGHYQGSIKVADLDPAQVKALSPYLRGLLGGKLTGDARVYGYMDSERRGDLVRLSDIDATLDRQRKGDFYPREVSIEGEVGIGQQSVSLRGVDLQGDGLDLTLPKGTVGLKSGRLNLAQVELRGGPRAARSLAALGVPGPVALKELAASVHILGTLSRPELEDGAFSMKGVDLLGQHLDEVVTGFTLHEGSLALQGVSAKGGDTALTGKASFQLFHGSVSDLLADPPLSVAATLDRLPLQPLLPGAALEGALSAQLELGGTVQRPTGTVSAQVPLLTILGQPLRNVTVDTELRAAEVQVNSLFAAIGLGAVNGSALIGRQGDLPLDIAVNPVNLALKDIPGVRLLPYLFDGVLSGALRVRGTARPLQPTLEGRLVADGLRVTGKPSFTPEETKESKDARQDGPGKDSREGRRDREEPVDELPEMSPIFRLPGAAVRTLLLEHAELAFRPLPLGGTQVSGRLFGAFDVSGAVYLDPLSPHGDLTLRFGCAPEPAGPAGAVGPGGPATPDSRTPRDCDLALERLMPDLQLLADVETHSGVSGELHLRFGRGLGGDLTAVGFSAQLLLRRALLSVKATDDDGIEHRYRMYNQGEVALASDGRALHVQHANFRTERQAQAGASAQSFGDMSISGFVDERDSDLRVLGTLRLELLEQALRATFQRTRGALAVDVRLRGPRSALSVTGSVDLRGARLQPHDVDAPVDVVSGKLEMSPTAAVLRDLEVLIDGARTRAQGTMAVKSYLPLQLGAMQVDLSGALSARLLQWVFRRSLSEARGRVDLEGVRVTGTLEAPLLAGVARVRNLYLNVRRFHELDLQQGSVRFVPESAGVPASILIGCVPGAPAGCQALEGTVDADGKLRMSGRVVHAGLGGFVRGPWYDPLRKLDLDLALQNVRHNSAGVYYIEVSAPGLRLYGDRDHATLSGSVDVVSGRYVQQFDLKDQFLSPRVIEEEEPFWRGDPYLSALQLDLSVATKGAVQVHNNLADLRLVTTDFTLSGPVSDIRMGGTIRVDSGLFNLPGLRGEFQVKGDSKLEFSPQLRLPNTPWVDVHGVNQQFDASYTQQRNVELALQGPVGRLQIQCISSDGLNQSDCAFYLALGGTSDQIRQQLAGDPSSTSPRALAAGDNAAKLLSSQITQQVADPLREKLKLDVMRIQLGVSSFDVLMCKNVGMYTRMCGQAERGLIVSGGRYQLFGELRFSDWTVGQLSLERLEGGYVRGSALLEDTLNRYKLQLGLRRPLRF